MLEVQDLRAGWGSGIAVDGVSLALAEGEAVALLGPNGAGKSTLCLCVAGVLRARSGRTLLRGKPARSGAHLRSRDGVLLVPEGRGLFPGLTVEENLTIGSLTRAGAERPSWSLTTQEAYERFPLLAQRRDDKASSLSGGQQQLLALVRAVVAGPEVLLVDEPSQGLAPVVVDEVFDLLADLSRQGLTLLVVEQSVAKALSIVSRYVVMKEGRIALDRAAAGTDADLASLSEAYFG